MCIFCFFLLLSYFFVREHILKWYKPAIDVEEHNLFFKLVTVVFSFAEGLF